MKNKYFTVLFSTSMLLFSFTSHAQTVSIDCDSGDSLIDAVNGALPGTTILVSGTCYESITITTDDLTLIGDDSGSKATLSGITFPFPQSLITVESAVRVNISGFMLEKGLFGVLAKDNASISVANTDIVDNTIGISITTNAHAHLKDINIEGTEPRTMVLGLEITDSAVVRVEGTINISGSHAFGFQVITTSSLTLLKDAIFNSTGNTLGGQISVGSAFFANDNASMNTNENSTIGFSCNTGSSCLLFNASINANDNGLDGVDIVSAGNLEVDGHSVVTATNNGREGISIDDSTVNLFGFFSTAPGLPKIVATNNGNNGVFVEFGSKLDIGRNSAIIASDNGAAGVRLDDNSSAIIQRSEITGNHGSIHEHNNPPPKHLGAKHHHADIIASFGSRISFRQNPDSAGVVTPNNVGVAFCDRSSRARGDIKCKRRNF